MVEGIREPFVPQPDTVIWRYMEDWKFKSMLEKFSEHEMWQPLNPGEQKIWYNEPGQLWFAHPSSFGDDKEGSLPDANWNADIYCDRLAELFSLSAEEAASRKAMFLKCDIEAIRKMCAFAAELHGISCWHMNISESSSMWSDFTQSKNGVAIRSTVENVEQSLIFSAPSPVNKAKLSYCAVGYVDHSQFVLPADGPRYRLSIIQECHCHENEIRFVAESPMLSSIRRSMKPLKMPINKVVEPIAISNFEKKQEYTSEMTVRLQNAFTDLKSSNGQGFNLPVDLKRMIIEVVVKPGSDPAYEAEVRKLLSDANCHDVQVRLSSL